MLDILGVIPLGVLPTRHNGKIGTEVEQVLHRFVRGPALTKLSKRGSQRRLGIEKTGHVDANRCLQRFCVFTLTIGMGKGVEAQHAGIIGIHLHGRFDHLTTSLLASVLQKQFQEGRRRNHPWD